MLNFDTVASAAHFAAWLAVLCAVGFFASYVWGLRDVFWCPRGRRGRADTYSWHLVVLHRDSRLCLRGTMADLAEAFPSAWLWVVADSTATQDIATSHTWFGGSNGARWRWIGDPVVSGDGEHAGLLDRVYAEITAIESDGHDPNQVLVGLLDTGSVLPNETFDYLAGRNVFADPGVGGVQLAGYVDTGETGPSTASRKRAPGRLGERTLLRAQDLAARGPEAAAQLARRRTRTAALGGPGQFLRLSALATVRGQSTTQSGAAADEGVGPLDDQGPTLSLWNAGWGTTYTPDVAVRATGVIDLGRYVDQRRAWARATMRRVGELRRVAALRGSGRNVAVALAAPWACVVGTVLLLTLGVVLTGLVLGNPAVTGTFVREGGWVAGVAFAVIAFGEAVVWGVVYGRRFHPRCGLVVGIAAGLVQLLLGMAHVLAVWYVFLDYLRTSTSRRMRRAWRSPDRQAGGRRRRAAVRQAPAGPAAASPAWASSMNQRPPAPVSTMVTRADRPEPAPVPAVSASVVDEPTRESRPASVWPSTVPAPAFATKAGGRHRA